MFVMVEGSMAQGKNPSKRHQFPQEIILMAVRWYCIVPGCTRLLSERGVMVDASKFHRWVRKFGPETRKRAYGAHHS